MTAGFANANEKVTLPFMESWIHFLIFQLIKREGNVLTWKKGDMFFPFLFLPGVISDSQQVLYEKSADYKVGAFPWDRSLQTTGPGQGGQWTSPPALPPLSPNFSIMGLVVGYGKQM